MQEIIEFKKMQTLTIKSFCNFGLQRIIDIFLVLYSAYVILRDQDEFVFYVNNYIYYDQLNKLYDPD